MTKINKMKEIDKIKKNFIIYYVEFLLLNFLKKYLLILKIRGQKNVDKSVFTLLNYGITILDKLVNVKSFSDKAKIFKDLESPLSENTEKYWLLLQDSPEYLKLVQELEDIIVIAKSNLMQNKFFYKFYKYYVLKTKEINNLVIKDKLVKKEQNITKNINNILLEIKRYDQKNITVSRFNI